MNEEQQGPLMGSDERGSYSGDSEAKHRKGYCSRLPAAAARWLVMMMMVMVFSKVARLDKTIILHQIISSEQTRGQVFDNRQPQLTLEQDETPQTPGAHRGGVSKGTFLSLVITQAVTLHSSCPPNPYLVKSRTAEQCNRVHEFKQPWCQAV